MWKPQGMYSTFLLQQPTVLCGNNSINGLVTYPGCKIAIVHGRSLSKEKKENINLIFKKKAVKFIQRSWNKEPNLVDLRGTIEELENYCPDIIIAIGGGAVIDGAKICRLFYEYPSFELGKTRINQLKFKSKFVVIPTTVGSGAEVSSAAVYVDEDTNSKKMIVTHDLQPEVVVLDPKYVIGCADDLLYSSGIDAMAHIIEGYVSNIANPLIDCIAENALKELLKELSKCSIEEMDLLRIQFAGYQGGIVQNHCIVGSAHAIAHQLTQYNYSHGEAVALLLPASIKQNCKTDSVKERYNILCEHIGLGGYSDLINMITDILSKTKFSKRASELKSVLNDKLNDLDFVNNIFEDQGGKGNPVKMNLDYLIEFVGEM